MKSLSKFLLVALCFCCTSAVKATVIASYPPTAKYYIEVPYETINGKMFIYADIGGKKRKLLFDTGAPSQISKDLFKELNAPVVSKVAVGDAFQHRDSVVVTTIPEVKLNNVSFKQITALVLYPDFYKCWNIDGVIGSNILAGTLLQIDADKHLMIFTNDDTRLKLIKEHAMNMTITGLQLDPAIKIPFNKKVNGEFHFDTGDSDFLLMTEDYMKQLSKFNVFETLSTGFGANNISTFGAQQQDTTYRLKIASLKIGGAEFKNTIVETDKQGKPRFGSKLLDYGTVTLDYIHSKFYFDAKAPVNDVYQKRWSVAPFIKDNQWVIGTVWQQASASVKPGDQIMSIDDVPSALPDLCERINGKPLLEGKEKATLTIKDAQGNIKKVEITKE